MALAHSDTRRSLTITDGGHALYCLEIKSKANSSYQQVWIFDLERPGAVPSPINTKTMLSKTPSSEVLHDTLSCKIYV